MDITLFSNKFRVKKITEKDIEKVLDLCECNHVYYKYCPPKPSIASIVDDLNALPPNKEYKDKYYVGFFEDDKMIAVMDLIYQYPNCETAFIGFFMMDIQLQGKGVGTRIISDVLKYLKTLNLKKVRLGYVKGNNQAKSFWKKNKFLCTGVEDKQEKYTVIVMERVL